MKRFAALWRALDSARSPARQEELLGDYFRAAPPGDAAWGLWLLLGNRPRRLVSPAQLRAWAGEEAGVPEWLVDASHAAVGDLAETASHLLDGREEPREWPLRRLVAERLEPLARASEDRRRELVRLAWRELPGEQRLLWNKLVTGGFRAGVKPPVVVRALAGALGGDEAGLTRRLAAGWTPSAASYASLLDEATPRESAPAGAEVGAWTAEGLGDAAGPRAEPHTVAAVLLYAQRGDGGRASHYTDLTLAVWDEGALVPVAKVESGLPATERTELDRWVRRHIVERFGPVRQVRPELVFELAFAGVEASARHKAGLVLRAPRLVRRLRDRAAADAATLAALRARLGAGD